MGELVDLDKARRERQTEKGHAASKLLALPKPAPLIDREWDEDAGRYVETVHVQGWSLPFHVNRDYGDET